MTLAELRAAGYSFNIGEDGYTVWYQAPSKPGALLRGAVRQIAQAKENCPNPGAEAVDKATVHHFMLQLER